MQGDAETDKQLVPEADVDEETDAEAQTVGHALEVNEMVEHPDAEKELEEVNVNEGLPLMQCEMLEVYELVKVVDALEDTDDVGQIVWLRETEDVLDNVVDGVLE